LLTLAEQFGCKGDGDEIAPTVEMLGAIAAY
jgi:hypothetical protein